jgi:hypothetical protein
MRRSNLAWLIAVGILLFQLGFSSGARPYRVVTIPGPGQRALSQASLDHTRQLQWISQLGVGAMVTAAALTVAEKRRRSA